MTKIDQTEFARLMDGLDPAVRGAALAVGCSGGPDSMALTLLLHDYCAERAIPLTALIVDHALRPDSGQEAAGVRHTLQKAGVAAEVLTRNGAPITSDIQNQARQARFDLMAGWCRAHDVRTLYLAHHRDDQAETVVMRLIRGSGVDGLAAMAPVDDLDGLTLVRPLLEVAKQRLVETVEASGIPYVLDPSNDSDAFTRVRVRKIMDLLAEEGLTDARLVATAAHMRRARTALDTDVRHFLDRSARCHDVGACDMDLAAYRALPEEVALRVLTRLIGLVSDTIYRPRYERLAKVHTAIISGKGIDRTLAGCHMLGRADRIWFARELHAAQPALGLPKNGTAVWDGRFRIETQAAASGLTIRPMGEDGWRQWREGVRPDPELLDIAAGFPGAVRHAAPALWQGETLLCPLFERGLTMARQYGVVAVTVILPRFFGNSDFSRSVTNTM